MNKKWFSLAFAALLLSGSLVACSNADTPEPATQQEEGVNSDSTPADTPATSEAPATDSVDSADSADAPATDSADSADSADADTPDSDSADAPAAETTTP